MRKLFLLILLLMQLNVQAQDLVDTGTVWSAELCINFGPCGYENYWFEEDTVIGSYTYKKFAGNFVGSPYPGDVIAARQDGDGKVYFYFNYGERLFYDFDLYAGDTFITDIGGCTIQSNVDSVDIVYLLNGEGRKRLWLSGISDVWIDGIGSIHGLIYMGLNNCITDFSSTLVCFKEDNILKYHDAAYDSCEWFLTGVSEILKDEQVKIYPNPVNSNSSFKIESPVAGVLKIYDVAGRAVYSDQVSYRNTYLVHQNFPPGIYFVKMSTEEMEVVQKLVVE
jgi:hypothetical protein